MDKRVIVTCPTLAKELRAVMEECNCTDAVHYLPARLHSDPKELRTYLQSFIDQQKDVQKILLCVSGCGGGTKGLHASTADLVIPQTADCIDILLSGSDAHRDEKGVFFTESWMNAMKNSRLDYTAAVRTLGKEQADEQMRKIYRGFEQFYIIDTGAYDTEAVWEYLTPLVEAINGSITVIPGKCDVLRKLVQGKWDDDFRVISKGQPEQ